MTNSNSSRFLVANPPDGRLLKSCHCSSLRVLGKRIAFFASFTGKKRGSSAGRFQALGRPIAKVEMKASSPLFQPPILNPPSKTFSPPRSSIPQDYHVPPFHPCLASRKTSTQTMARSAVDESSTTPLWPFPAAKLRLIAIPQLARDGDRGQEGSPKGTFEVEVGCFLVQQKYILN